MSLDTRSGNFYFFPLVALRYQHVRKSNFDAELKNNAFPTGDFLYTGKNEVSETFPRKIHHNKFYFFTCSMHDSFIGINPCKKNENDVLHV